MNNSHSGLRSSSRTTWESPRRASATCRSSRHSGLQFWLLAGGGSRGRSSRVAFELRRAMKVGFNARLLADPNLRGWNRYTVNLLAELPALGCDTRLRIPTDRFTLIISARLPQGSFRGPHPTSPPVCVVGATLASLAMRRMEFRSCTLRRTSDCQGFAVVRVC